MDLKKQVCSLELAKKLKELGVPQESLFKWVGTYNENYVADPTFWQKEEYQRQGRNNWVLVKSGDGFA